MGGSSNRSPSKPRSQSRGRKTVAKPSKSPAKRGQKKASKSPSRRKNTSAVAAKTPGSAAVGRPRSKSVSRKVNTAPPAPSAAAIKAASRATTPVARGRSRSRSRTRNIPQQQSSPRLAAATVASAQPSAWDELKTVRSRRGVPSVVAAPTTTPTTPAANSRAARYASKQHRPSWWQRVVNTKNYYAQKLRGASGGRSSSRVAKIKRHVSTHAKHYALVIVLVLFALLAYKFSHELLAQLHDIGEKLTEFVETQRQIFGAYLEETRMRLENAKNQLYERTFATTTEQPPRIVTPTSKRPPVDTSTGKIPHTNHPINT